MHFFKLSIFLHSCRWTAVCAYKLHANMDVIFKFKKKQRRANTHAVLVGLVSKIWDYDLFSIDPFKNMHGAV